MPAGSQARHRISQLLSIRSSSLVMPPSSLPQLLALVLAVMDVVLVTTTLAGLEQTAVAWTAAAVIAWRRDCDSSDGDARSHKHHYQQTYDTARLHVDPPSLGLDDHNLFPDARWNGKIIIQ